MSSHKKLLRLVARAFYDTPLKASAELGPQKRQHSSLHLTRSFPGPRLRPFPVSPFSSATPFSYPTISNLVPFFIPRLQVKDDEQHRAKAMKYDTDGLAVVVIDALTREEWVNEADLAVRLKMNPNLLRRVLRMLEQERVSGPEGKEEKRSGARGEQNGNAG
jgi:ribosomal protein S25